MDWIRNNKFMAGFLGFMAVGVIVLGYLLYTGYSRYDDVAQQYNKQVSELERLQNLQPFPDAKGLQKFTELRRNYSSAVKTLQMNLAAYEPPPENPPLTPVQFADKLRKVVEDVTAAAQNVGMALPENFYMGFEQYRGSPPDVAAAPLLSQELDAINDLVGLLLKQHVARLTSITRGRLPHEAGGPTAPAAPAANGPRGGKAEAAEELVVRYPVEILFTAQPSAFHAVLDEVTSAKRLYILRAVQIKNEMDKAPLRDDPSLAVVGGVDQAGAPAAAEPPGTDQNGVPVPPLPKKGPAPLRYVVGLEKLDADLRIELVKIAPPDATLAAAK